MRRMRPRVIPALLLSKGRRLVKTVKYTAPTYVGDPLNAIKIFNEKGVDELAVLDIESSAQKTPPDFDYLKHLAEECFMPLAYGGGITKPADVEKLVGLGIEKVIIGTALKDQSGLIKEAVQQVGGQSVVASIDAKPNLFGKYHCFVTNARVKCGDSPVDMARRAEDLGAGEILLNAVHRDGTMEGYDLALIKQVSQAVQIPVIACGGAGKTAHLGEAVKSGASAVAAGSLFVFRGPHRAVLINVPSEEDLNQTFFAI